jgi:diguanylate cyclase (GGDEF)-like protein/PAS domain S-box-containing protein
MHNSKGSILIIDDDEFNHKLLKTNLETNGYNVELANNGLEGIEKLKTQRIDLVLLDLLMPEMDGFAVLKKMKSVGAWHSIPVIVTSAEMDPETIAHCIEKGAIDYLIKPFDPVLLQTRIKNALFGASYLKTGVNASFGRVLVVDDDPLYRTLLTINLEENGHGVTEAENGKKALEELEVQEFDLIFLDLLMPEMDGFELLQILKSDNRFEHIPVIVISAENDMNSVVRCIEMGARDYLNKPYESEILKARMNASLASKRLHDREKAYLKNIQSSQVAVSIENVKLHRSVHSKQEQYETLIDNIPVGVYRIDVSQNTKGQFLQVNPALVKILHYECTEELMQKHALELYNSIDERNKFMEVITEFGTCKDMELHLRTKDESVIIGSCTAKAKYDNDGKLLWVDGVIEDITEKKKLANQINLLNKEKAKAEEQIRINLERSNLELEEKVLERTYELEKMREKAEKLARTDPLTDLPNRRAFFEQGEIEVYNVRTNPKPLSVIMLDIDYFKNINDIYGHDIGDVALQSLATVIENEKRDRYIVGRMGGEEFALVLPDTNESTAIEFAENLRIKISEIAIKVNEKEIKFTASFGLTEYNKEDISLHSTLSRADKALYIAKKNGRNQVVSK